VALKYPKYYLAFTRRYHLYTWGGGANFKGFGVMGNSDPKVGACPETYKSYLDFFKAEKDDDKDVAAAVACSSSE
jgi:hypothetical protein